MFQLLFISFVGMFGNYMNNIITTIGVSNYIAQTVLKNNINCNTDDDCPYIMRCCQTKTNYCCTPNNYIKMVPIKIPIKSDNNI